MFKGRWCWPDFWGIKRARDLQTSQKHSSFGSQSSLRLHEIRRMFHYTNCLVENKRVTQILGILGIHLFMFKEMEVGTVKTTHPVDILFTVRSRLLLCLRHLECRHGDFWAQHRKISICGPVTWGVVVVVSMLKILEYTGISWAEPWLTCYLFFVKSQKR